MRRTELPKQARQRLRTGEFRTSIINALNGIPQESKPETAAVARIQQLIEFGKQLVHFRRAWRGRKPRVLQQVNNLLKGYQSSYAFTLSALGPVLEVCYPGNRRWEHSAAIWVSYEIANRNVGRFRRCRECRKWFYALTSHQRYHSENCRKRHHSHSPVFKEKRRVYMSQVYRPRERLLAQNAAQKRTSH